MSEKETPVLLTQAEIDALLEQVTYSPAYPFDEGVEADAVRKLQAADHE